MRPTPADHRPLRLLAILCAALLLGGCDRAADEPTWQETLLVFGTLVDITVHGGDEATFRRAVREVEDDLGYLHEALHAWQPGSLGRTNLLLATGGTFTAPPSVLPLVEQSRQLAEQSDHLFNPAIGQLIALWGFHGETPSTPPDEAAIAALLEQTPRMDQIVIDGIRLRATNPAVQLDLGAIAKGYAVDRALELLHDHGLVHAIVNAGGDLRASGQRGDRPWRIGIRDPRGEGMLAVVETRGNEALFTSGDYERYFEHDGVRYHHILDPRSGRPARGLTSVTVLHDDGTVADAASTALFVAGPEAWPAIAAQLGVDHVMVIDEAGAIQLTPAMAERVRFEQRQQPRIVPLP